MDDFEKELKFGFLDEAAQAVADVEQCFLSLEADPKNEENLNKIFRLAHNLKGSSKAVGFSQFGDFTHEFENFILKVKKGELEPTAGIISLLLEANDFVQTFIEGLKQDLDARFDYVDLLNKMKNPVDASKNEVLLVESAEETITSVSENKPEASMTLEDTQTILSEEAFAAEVGKAMLEAEQAINNKSNAVDLKIAIEQDQSNNKESTSKESAAAPRQQVGSPSKHSGAEENIRVSLSKVESLLNYVGEMVILQSVLREQIQYSESPLLKKTVQMLGKVSKELQDTAMGLRMVPLKPVFQKMVRIVRDTSVALGKEVQLNLTGEDVELDKTVLDKLSDPLVHLIRNAVDHGIESPNARQQAGKSFKGVVHLKAFHSSGKLVIEVIDDGGGLSPEKLIRKATEKGILKSGATMTDKEAFALIFAAGFSTKEQVTDVSGRGVGMDVVRTNIQEMGGEVTIDSVLGKGTTFRIILPLTLAIVDSMVVTYSNHKFVIPLTHVHETVPTKDHQIRAATGIGDVILLRGENLPIYRLGDFFGIASHTPSADMITVIIRTGPEPFALMIDDILGQFQVVIKQLGPELQNIKGISGITILGDGRPSLILEPSDLIKRKLSSNYKPLKSTIGAKAI